MVLLEMKPLIWSRISLFGEELAGSGIMCEIAAPSPSSIERQLVSMKQATSAWSGLAGRELGTTH
jgi:hypothetical protein